MEKVSTKEFFTVMWRGVRQALGWFFGLFGYKRDGKFAKCVWGLFATSGSYSCEFMCHSCDIEAIGYDLYICTSTNSDKVIVNGKGEIVK